MATLLRWLWPYLLTAFLAGAGGWQLCKWIHEGDELKEARTNLANEQLAHERIVTDLSKRLETVREASDGYQRELQAIRAQPASIAPVRLCRDPANTRLPETHPAEPRSDAAAPATGLVQSAARDDLAAGDDIGPSLRALARRADEVLAQARGLQRAAR